MKPIIEQIASAERELALRIRVYPKLVARGTLQPEQAGHEIVCMESIIRSLEDMRHCRMVPNSNPNPEGFKTEMKAYLNMLKANPKTAGRAPSPCQFGLQRSAGQFLELEAQRELERGL